jgi:hypothetical protein
MSKRPRPPEEADDGWPIFALWRKYEEVAMHFNDLLIRLRTQALAGVAALSALTGLFAKADLGPFSYSWEVAGMIFLALSAFWLAVWLLDFCYYNELLVGSVAALLELEERSKTHKTIPAIQLSTLVEKSVKEGVDLKLTPEQKRRIRRGRVWFYIIVMAALLAGALFSFWTYCHQARDAFIGINH